MPKGSAPKYRRPNGNLLSGGQQDVFREIFDAAGEPVGKEKIMQNLKISESNLNRRLTIIREKLGSDAVVTEGRDLTLGDVSGMTVGLKGSFVKRKSKEG
jgi:hypothetical protein